MKLLLLCIAVALLAGCTETTNDSIRDASAPAASRVVCASPAVVEIVFALGCGESVVGVSDHTIYPPEALLKEKIGSWTHPNRERLLVLKPDLILTQGRHETLASFAKEYGIRLCAVRLDTLNDFFDAVTVIAEALGESERGARLNAEITAQLDAVRAKTTGAPIPATLILLGRMPGAMNGLTTAGPGTFLNDMLALSGGSNVFADAIGMYPIISKESLLARNPEVILEIQPGGLPDKDAALRLEEDWREFKSIAAVQDRRIHVLTNDFLLIPGPRLGKIALDIAGALHPGLFQE